MHTAARESHGSELLVYLYKLYQDHQLTDMQVVAADWKVFNVHRIILTAASEYMHNAICKDTMEGRISIDAPSDVLAIVLDYCYTGQLFVPAGQWMNVYNLATLLQMYKLLELMNDMQTKNIPGNKIENVVAASEAGPDVTKVSSEPELELDMSQVDGFTDASDQESSTSFVEVKTEVASEGDIFNDVFTESRSRPTQGRKRRSKVKSGVDLDYNPTRTEKRAKVKQENDRKRSKGSDEKIDEEESESILDTEKKKKRSDKGQGQITGKRPRGRPPGRKNTTKIKTELDDSPVKKRTYTKRKTCNFSEISEGQETVGSRSKLYVPKGQGHWCDKCSKMFYSKCQYNMHWYRCNPGSYVALSRSRYLLKDARQMSKFFVYKTTKQCTASSDTIEEGRKAVKDYECHLCRKSFTKYSLMSLHFVRRHKKIGKQGASGWLRYHQTRVQIRKKSCKIAKNRKELAQTKFTNLKSRLRAVKKEEEPRMKVQCHVCHNMLASQKTLDSHLRRIHKVPLKRPRLKPALVNPPSEPLFQCYKCKRCLTSKPSLVAHLRSKHGLSPVEANDKYSVLTHELPCDVTACTFRTNHLMRMKEHVLEKHPFLKKACVQCPKVFWVEMSLKRHIYKCHELEPHKFHCSQCDKRFQKGGHMRRHEFWNHGIHHDNITTHHCDHDGCDYKTLSMSSLKVHKTKHGRGKNFQCQYCHMKLKTEKIMKKHVAKMHLGIRPFLCQVCGSSFGEETELRSHMNNRHPVEKGYRCEYCPYSTSNRGTFFTHMFNVHKKKADEDKRKIYYCSQCTFSSVLNYRFQLHLNSHTDTRNYVCHVCSNSFISAATLRSHIQWRHSDKVISCSQCNYQTKTRQKLNEHIRVQHQLKGFKPYKCPYCTFSCATGGNTRKHVKQVHKDQPVTYIRDNGVIDAARKARENGFMLPMMDLMPSDMVNFLDNGQGKVAHDATTTQI